MAIKTVNDLFVWQLRDMYSAGKQAVRAYPKLAKATRSQELRSALEGQAEQTRNQIERLDRVFEVLEKKSSGKTCEAMKGLIGEARDAAEEIGKGPVLDLAIIAACQQLAHYDIASYGTAVAAARALHLSEIDGLLSETLGEQRAMDERLSALATAIYGQLLPGATTGSDDEVEESPLPRSAVKVARKKVASKSKKS